MIGRSALPDRREPILGSLPTLAFATLDDPMMFKFAQSGGENSARDQWYPALDVIERADIGHQFAQDERHPPHGNDFRCFRNRAELIVAVMHGGY